MKLNKFVLANALGATFGALSIGCMLIILVFPDLYVAIESLWSHGRNLSILGPARFDLASGLISAATFAGFGWITGYMYDWFLELFSKRK